MLYKRMSNTELRHFLDADNMDSKDGIAQVCALVSGHCGKVFEELSERVCIYELLAICEGEIDPKLAESFRSKIQEIDNFAQSALSMMLLLDSFISAAAASGADSYLFVNRFLNNMEVGNKELDHNTKLAYLGMIHTNTSEFAKKVKKNGNAS